MFGNKRWLITLGLVVIVLVALAACAPAPTPAPTAAPPTAAPAATAKPAATTAPAAGKVPVGIVLPTKDEPRWIQDQTRFQDALKAAGYDVQILFSQGSSATEKANVESLLSQGIKVLIICPQDASAAAAAVDEAHAAGVKVISYDRLIRDTASVDYYVTFDSISVGKAQGQYLIDKASGKGNPLYLYAGAATDNNAFLFFDGAWSVLQPKIADGTFVIKNSDKAVGLQGNATLTRDQDSTIIGQITTNWDFAVAKKLAQDNLTAAKAADKGNVFILAPNDGTARSIADTFAADKDVKSYVVTGQDAEEPSVQYIIDGKQSMTVLKDVRVLVKDAIAAAVAYLTGQTPAKTTTYNNGKTDVPAKPSAVVTVDKANVKAAVIDSGYWPAADFKGLTAATAPTAAPTAAPKAAPLKVGLVTDVGSLQDKSFNATAFKGVTDAISKLGIEGKAIESRQQTDYAKNITTLLQENTQLIITVGFLLGPDTGTYSVKNPNTKFAIVDYTYPDCYPGAVLGKDCGSDKAIPNVRGLAFQTDQAAFMAGYLAAGMSKTGKVGTFGGLQIPTVTIFMKGFQSGVDYYNTVKKTSVKVLGWDTKADKGLFTGDFNAPDKGKTSAKSLIDEGADIVMPVAGLTGTGAFTAVKEAGGYAIGVDVDQCVSVPDACPVLLTSVRKNMDVAVYDTIKSVQDGKFQGGTNYVGTLANNGVSIAPFNQLDSKVPAALKTELDQIKADLISGKIKTGVADLQ